MDWVLPLDCQSVDLFATKCICILGPLVKRKRSTHLNTSLDARLAIDYATKKYGLLREHFDVTNHNKIVDRRVLNPPLIVVELLVRTCNIPIQSALPALQTLHEQQLSINRSIYRDQPKPEATEDVAPSLPSTENNDLRKGEPRPEANQRHSRFRILRSNRDSGDWIWHDLKSGESGSIVTFLKLATGINEIKAKQVLSTRFSEQLLKDNHDYYRERINKALETATNERALELEMQQSVNARQVKVSESHISISNFKITLQSLGLQKSDVLSRFRENRMKISWDRDNHDDGMSFN